MNTCEPYDVATLCKRVTFKEDGIIVTLMLEKKFFPPVVFLPRLPTDAELDAIKQIFSKSNKNLSGTEANPERSADARDGRSAESRC